MNIPSEREERLIAKNNEIIRDHWIMVKALQDVIKSEEAVFNVKIIAMEALDKIRK